MAIKNIKKDRSYNVVCGFDIDGKMRKEVGEELKESDVSKDELRSLLEMNCIEEK